MDRSRVLLPGPEVLPEHADREVPEAVAVEVARRGGPPEEVPGLGVVRDPGRGLREQPAASGGEAWFGPVQDRHRTRHVARRRGRRTASRSPGPPARPRRSPRSRVPVRRLRAANALRRRRSGRRQHGGHEHWNRSTPEPTHRGASFRSGRGQPRPRERNRPPAAGNGWVTGARGGDRGPGSIATAPVGSCPDRAAPSCSRCSSCCRRQHPRWAPTPSGRRCMSSRRDGRSRSGEQGAHVLQVEALENGVVLSIRQDTITARN